MCICGLTAITGEAKKQAALATNPSSIVSGSTFEKYKAVQRKHRRNGHKTHKKKYKDYLRYAWATNPTMTYTERTVISNNIDIATDKYDKAINATIPTTIMTGVAGNKENRHWQRAQKLQAEISRGFPAPPIFVITSNHEKLALNSSTAKPFYEGQINYYLETKDDDFVGGEAQQPQRNTVASSDSWYRGVSPMLRNGLRATQHNQLLQEQQQNKEIATINHLHQRQHNHHNYQQHQQQHHNQHQHRRTNAHENHPEHHHNHHHVHHFSHAFHHRRNGNHQKHHKKQQHTETELEHMENLYEQHLIEVFTSTTPKTTNAETTTTIDNKIEAPAATRASHIELAHQITEMEELQRYYAKWPHLARVQFQVYEDHLRDKEKQLQPHHKQANDKLNENEDEDEDEDDEYPEYEYESLAALEEAQHASAEDANVPPYIRKYNRRNKQLLNLLEGPLPPPKGYHWSGSKLQPGPAESSSDASTIRLDDEYMREKRKRYKLLHNNKNDLFAQQRRNVSVSPTTQTAVPNFTTEIELSASNNNLPNEYVLQSAVSKEDTKEITNELKSHVNGNKVQISWQIEKLLTPFNNSTPAIASTATPKSLVFRLPSFNGNYGNYGMRQRSRSAHFAPSPGQRRHMSGFLDSMELHGYDELPDLALANNEQYNQAKQPATSTSTETSSFFYQDTPKPTPARPKMPTPPPRSISAFVYHRVVDNSEPRQVGTGAGVQGRKQQLPFVAITDRRLETFKKSLLERQKEFEQNNFPALP